MKIFTEKPGIKLSNNEKDIISFINKNPNEFVKLNISQLSKKLFVSIGSISRLSKKMKFESFRDMKSFVIKESLRNEKYYQLKNVNSANSIIHNIKVYNRHTVEKTADILKLKSINETSKLIYSASRVISYGLGSSALAAEELTNNLNRNAINSVFAPTIHDVIVWLRKKVEKNILIIIFSKSMGSKDNIFLMKLLKKYNIKTIVITENTKIKKEENLLPLHFQTLGGIKGKMQISSKISQLFITDIIITHIAKNIDNNNTDIYNEFQEKWKD